MRVGDMEGCSNQSIFIYCSLKQSCLFQNLQVLSISDRMVNPVYLISNTSLFTNTLGLVIFISMNIMACEEMILYHSRTRYYSASS